LLDLKYVRNNPEKIEQSLKNRGGKINLDTFLKKEAERREILMKVEGMKAKRNAVSQEIGKCKKAGSNAEDQVLEMRRLGDEIKDLDEKLKEIEMTIQKELLNIPNVPHESVPLGLSEEDNVEIRKWGESPGFDFEPKPHWEIGEKLGILDFERASKVTGARFTFYKGPGALLERALVNFYLDLHTSEHGYTEIFPPFMVHRDSMFGTGQLPKFEEDAFRIDKTDYYLIPTAEVPVTNLYRGEILEGSALPVCYCAYSACFRAEAGAAGRDTRGLIRQHQFNKVELVKFVHPEKSYDELERLTKDAEDVLQKLGLAYRVVVLSTGDLGFSAAKTYDIEVWLPSFNKYREISSCSNFENYQARRANIRFRRSTKDKPEFIHTINGSGVAIGRTVAAILENYQQEDGSVKIPSVLQKYMSGLEVIK
jgi:seryl-tRNA synthetase